MAFRYSWDTFEEWCESNNGIATQEVVDGDGNQFYGSPESVDADEVSIRATCEFEEANEKFVMESNTVDVDEPARITGNNLGSTVGEGNGPERLDNFNPDTFTHIRDGEVVETGEGHPFYGGISRNPSSPKFGKRGLKVGDDYFIAPSIELDDWDCTYTVSVYSGVVEGSSIEEAKKKAVRIAEDEREEAIREGVTQQKGGIGSQPYKAQGHYFLQDLNLENIECEPA